MAVNNIFPPPFPFDAGHKRWQIWMDGRTPEFLPRLEEQLISKLIYTITRDGFKQERTR
jgi:hypothetical protein